MYMWMEGEILAPSMENGNSSHLCPEVFGVMSKGKEGFFAGLE